MRRWVETLFRHERLIWVGLALFCVVAATALGRLRLEMDVLALLPHGHENADDYRKYLTRFRELDWLIVLVEGKDAARFASRFAERLGDLEEVDDVAGTVSPEAWTRFLREHAGVLLPESAVAEIEARLRPEAIRERVREWKKALASPLDLSGAMAFRTDPLGILDLVRREIAPPAAMPGGDARILMVRPVESALGGGFAGRLLAAVGELEAETRRELGDPEVRVAMTGSYVYAAEDEAMLRGDLRRYVGLAGVAVLAVFFLGMRSAGVLAFAAVSLGLVTLATFAASVVVFDRLDAVSLAFAAILYGLAIDAAIHVYVRLLEERRRHDPDEAVIRTFEALWPAQVAATVTTFVAFSLVGLSALEGVSQLGWMTAIGMVVNAALFFLVQPLLARRLAARERVRHLETPRLEALAELLARHRGVGLVAVAGITVAAAFVAFPIRFDPSLDRLRPSGSPAAGVEAEIRRRLDLVPGNALAVLVDGTDLQETLVRAEEVARRLEPWTDGGPLADVRDARSLLPSHALQRERIARLRELPLEPAREAFRSALRENGFAASQVPDPFEPLEVDAPSLDFDDPVLAPLSTLLDSYVRSGEGWASVALHVRPAAGVDAESVAGRIRHETAERIPREAADDVAVASRELLEAELGGLLRRDVRRFLLGTLVANLVVVALVIRRLRAAVAATVPAFVSLALLLAAVAVSGVSFDPVSVVVLPLVLGIGIDDAVYLTVLATRPGESLGSAFRSGGRAIVVTSLTTIAGFACLALSRYPAFANLGLLGALGLVVALVSSLVVLPLVLPRGDDVAKPGSEPFST